MPRAEARCDDKVGYGGTAGCTAEGSTLAWM